MVKGPFLISACLLGVNCRRHQRNIFDQQVLDIALLYGSIPVCPELLGGMERPHDPCEIVGGDGHGVLDYQARVVDIDGKNYSAKFVLGAEETYRLFCTMKCTGAILAAKSPSCGSVEAKGTYAGSFDGKLKLGDGVLTAYLRRKGVAIYSEFTLHHIPGLEDWKRNY